MTALSVVVTGGHTDAPLGTIMMSKRAWAEGAVEKAAGSAERKVG